MRRLTMLGVVLALGAGPAVADPPGLHSDVTVRVAGDYVYTGSTDVGPAAAWDYATFAGGRIYLGHRDSIAVIDPIAGKVVGTVTGLDEAHGAAVDVALGKGFATSGGDGMLKEFDLTTFADVKDIPTGKDSDGVIFDPGAGVVLVTVGDAKQLVIVDAKSAAVTHQVDLPGSPEFVAADGKGRAFVNIASTGQLARVDIASGKVEAVWDLTGCQRPHGLAYDHKTRRLFAGCANAKLVEVDPDSGKLIATLPAGPQNDAMIVDEARGRVFCPNGDGTLTEAKEGPGDTLTPLRTIPTFLGARSGAIDPKTGVIYLTYGQIQIVAGPRDPGGLKFGWSSAKIAAFAPND
ncbi:MAG TPA: hypothetical protein VGL58_21395 [Caulobacteraceae bacterium]|jgi:DNA-binding beta-propeller fold protein YncE